MTAFPMAASRRVVLLGVSLLLAPLPLHAQSVSGPGPRVSVGVGAALALVDTARSSEPAAVSASLPAEGTFLARQLDYPRVRAAYTDRAEELEAALDRRGIEEVREVFFRVFKREQELEVWVREPGEASFTRMRTYPVCAISGRLGPKRRQGDRQIPEGFYEIDLFNPWSRFHLSMRVNYPNAVDRVRGHRSSLGGDIYVHGGCATIGCVPVTDDYIEELYLLAANARSAGQRTIPIHIFPTRLDEAGLRWLATNYGTNFVDYPFWQNLQEGYRAFESSRTLPRVAFEGGRYTFEAGLPTGPIGTVVEPNG